MSNRSSQNSLHEDLLDLVTRTTCHGLTSWGFAWGVSGSSWGYKLFAKKPSPLLCLCRVSSFPLCFLSTLGLFCFPPFASLESVLHFCFPSSRPSGHDVQSVFHLLLPPQFASVSMESVLHCLCVSLPPWDCIAFLFSFSRKCPPFPFSLPASLCA